MTEPLRYPWTEALVLAAATNDLAVTLRQVAQGADAATEVIAAWRGRGRITFDRDLEDHVAAMLQLAGTLESQVALMDSHMNLAALAGAVE